MSRVLARSGTNAVVMTGKRGNKLVRYSGLNLEVLPRGLAVYQKEAMEEGLKFWRRTHAPRHFQVVAYTRYGGKEKDVYEKRKPLRKSHSTKRPMVRSGKLQRGVLTGPFQVKASGSGGAIKVRGRWLGYTMRAANLYKPGGRAQNRHNFRSEITIMDDKDKRSVERFIKIDLNKRLRAAGVTK